MSWITENLTHFVTDFITGALDYLGQFLNNIYAWIVEMALMNEYFISAERFITATALLLIVLVVIKVVIVGYLMETDYDSEADPFNLLIKIAQTVAVILNASWIFTWLFKMGKEFTSDLIHTSSAENYCEKTKELLFAGEHMNEGANSFACYIIMLFIVLISVVVFTIVAGLRAGELIAMKLLFPYFALDLLTNSRERWNNFFTAYVVAFFSYAFQMLFYMIAMKSYMRVSSGNAFYSITTIVFLILAIRAPKFLEKYMYKSGFSNAASGGIRMVVQTAVMRGALR